MCCAVIIIHNKSDGGHVFLVCVFVYMLDTMQRYCASWFGNGIIAAVFTVCYVPVLKNILLVFLHCETFNELYPITSRRHQIMLNDVYRLKKIDEIEAVPLFMSNTHLLPEVLLKVNGGAMV